SLHSYLNRGVAHPARSRSWNSERVRQGSNQVFGGFSGNIPPGGFVEIDEEDLSKRKARTKLRVFAGGSFTNVVSWFLVVLLITNFALAISPLYDSKSSGVLITGLVNGGAAQNNNVASWSVLVAVNGTTVNSVESLSNVLSPLTPGHHSLLTINKAASNTQTPDSITIT